MELDLPDPPTLPNPKLWQAGLAVAVQLFASEYIYVVGTTKTALFFSGVLSCMAGVTAVQYMAARRQTSRMQAEMDADVEAIKESFAQARLRFEMIPHLLERYGAKQTMDLLNTAERLVGEGDFNDIRDAVASLERFNDVEPTTYDED